MPPKNILRKRKTTPVVPKKENRVKVLVVTSGTKMAYGYEDSGKGLKPPIVKRIFRKRSRKHTEQMRRK